MFNSEAKETELKPSHNPLLINIKLILLMLALTGCNSTPGVTPIGDNTYSVIYSGKSGFVSLGGIKADA